MSELNIEVLFESWLIYDGNDPSFKKNKIIRPTFLSSDISKNAISQVVNEIDVEVEMNEFHILNLKKCNPIK
ncbi:MAG: hypothetical protein JXR69_04750 [Candidatus Delongbacteria bacterium]|nr:hypothetical protein [Candidatus Delongbacteria bacterium]